MTRSQFTGMWHPKLNPVHLDSGLKDFFGGWVLVCPDEQRVGHIRPLIQ